MSMNLIKTFEERMNTIFGSSTEGFTAPFSIKKLAKRAAREMEAETFEIDGINTAPALYTVLVSPTDDATMRSLYVKLISEISAFIEAKAQSKSYVFTGKPLIRFMVDPGLKSGKFAVFAENIDASTLARLRAEEDAFLSGSLGVGGAAQEQLHGEVKMVNPPRARQRNVRFSEQATPQPPVSSPNAMSGMPNEGARVAQGKPAYKPTPRQNEVAAANPQNSYKRGVVAIPDETSAGDFAPLIGGQDLDLSAGLSVLPSNLATIGSASISTPPVSVMPAAQNVQHTPLVNVRADNWGRHATTTDDANSNRYAQNAYPAAPDGMAPTQRRDSFSQPVQNYAEAATPTSLLINHQTGETYEVFAPQTIIGRERSHAQIVLRDSNISRRHAQITYNGRNWLIQDLGSTNGTQVNNMTVDSCVLRNGDIITLALTNLEFREN